MAKGDSTGVSATGGGQPNGVSNTNPMEQQNWQQNFANASAGGNRQQMFSNFFKSRGVSDKESPYWDSKWDELNARGKEIGDPDYAMKRLNAAEIFGGHWMEGGDNNTGNNSMTGGQGGGRQWAKPMRRRMQPMGMARSFQRQPVQQQAQTQTPIGPSGNMGKMGGNGQL